MAGEANPVRVPTPGAYLGTFHIRRFNVAFEADRNEYERLRTAANSRTSGIVIENIRDQTENQQETDLDGNTTTTQTWFIVVSWWDKGTQSKKPDSSKAPDPGRGFYIEKTVGGEG